MSTYGRSASNRGDDGTALDGTDLPRLLLVDSTRTGDGARGAMGSTCADGSTESDLSSDITSTSDFQGSLSQYQVPVHQP